MLHDLRSLQAVAAVNHIDLGGKLRQKVGFLHSGVATTHNSYGFVSEEEAITGCTPAHAVARELLLLRKSQLSIGSTSCKDYGLRLKLLATTGLYLLYLALEINLNYVVKQDFCPKALGLSLEVGHQIRPHQAIRETGEVLNLGGLHQLTTWLNAGCNHQWVELSSRGIDGGGVAGRAGTNDDDFSHFYPLMTTT